MRAPRYDILFEPVAIGALQAKNRFFQVPHCNGGGHRDPSAAAAMRAVKAEGGWGVVFTEQCEIHPTSEITPFIELRLWDDQDIPALARMAEQIKAHGALAGIQLAYSGINGPNFYSREVPRAVTALPIRTFTNDPLQARALDKAEIGDLRRWFLNAAKRARQAGFDLICLYGAHGFGIFQHFLSPATNQRSDEYGGSLENRSRFLRETVTDIRDALGEELAISLRIALEERDGFTNAEMRDFIEMHRDLPDLWDVARGSWEECSATSRFEEEGAQQHLAAGIRELTDKPVVGVGRFTSPDVMVRQITSGVLDFIGCARPSIADPFLPRKIEEGRIEDIRECIGCNICIAGDMTMSISRCTQNPAFMEEWRKGWHPETMNPKGASANVLVVGSGPAGLEAARALSLRGYEVVLAEARDTLGGRVTRESALPGLATWARVKDYRIYQLSQRANVQTHVASPLNAEDILQFGFAHVAIATGAVWRRDGVSRQHVTPMPIDASMPLYTPDDLMDGNIPDGEVLVYDDDHYYIGGVLAELLVQNGARVVLLTPAPLVSEWSVNTLEQPFIHKRLLDLGVEIRLNQGMLAIDKNHIVANCIHSGKTEHIPAQAVVMVASRTPVDALYLRLQERREDWRDAGIRSVTRFGDAEAPAPIAWAVYAGHRYARELDGEPPRGDAPAFRREVAQLGDMTGGMNGTDMNRQ